MKKGMIFTFCFLVLGVWGTYQSDVVVAKASAADNNMAQVQLILKKLRSSMANMKDFDELEAAGMDKADVDRLRKAMKAKIKQMTSDAVDLIRVL
jgi:hypothetical protein